MVGEPIRAEAQPVDDREAKRKEKMVVSPRKS
jgi:hypothetical protein